MTTDTLVADRPLLDLMLKRMQERGDLPGFESSVRDITASMNDPECAAEALAQAVLADLGLTQRVLRLANSSMYKFMDQEVTTISRAIVVLGTETIGHVALGLKILSEFDRKSDDPSAFCLDSAGCAAAVVRELTSEIRIRDTEEAVVCALMHRLGRVLATTYIPEHLAAIEANEASGESFVALGQAVAINWGLPSAVVRSMVEYDPSKREGSTALSHDEWLSAISSFSNAAVDAEENPDALTELADNFSSSLGIPAESLVQGVQRAATRRAEGRPPAPLRAVGVDRATLLERNLRELQALPSSTPLSQVIATALEGIHSAAGFNRSIAFLYQPKKQHFVPKISLGEKTLAGDQPPVVVDAYAPDVLHVALQSDRIVHVSDAYASNIASRVPKWWPENFGGSKGFLVVPLCVGKARLGFFYFDWVDLELVPDEVRLLNEIRSQAMSFVSQRQQESPSTRLSA
ncbi:MAG: HDOD domain-containing protein [Desulforhabdus sp.]|jgi:HD-like signal output (HDOD) protein|nr:HDOD domain-containing protein [Desulforhabdus sp.]